MKLILALAIATLTLACASTQPRYIPDRDDILALGDATREAIDAVQVADLEKRFPFEVLRAKCTVVSIDERLANRNTPEGKAACAEHERLIEPSHVAMYKADLAEAKVLDTLWDANNEPVTDLTAYKREVRRFHGLSYETKQRLIYIANAFEGVTK